MMEPARSVAIPAVARRSVEEPKWRALRTIAFLLKTLAWLIFASSIVSSTLVVIMGVPMPLAVNGIPFLSSIPATLLGSIVVAIITIVGALLAFLILFAMSELILLLVTIERNTRTRY
jgi:hypothetical protein